MLLLRIVCSVHYWLVVFTGGIINLGVAKSSRLSCRLLCWFALSFMPSRLSAVGLLPWLPQHFPGSLGLHLIVLSPLFPRQLSHFRSMFGPLVHFWFLYRVKNTDLVSVFYAWTCYFFITVCGPACQFFPCMSWRLCENLGNCCGVSLFLYPHWLACLSPCQHHAVLCVCHFSGFVSIVRFKCRCYNTPRITFILRVLSAVWGLPYGFSIFL